MSSLNQDVYWKNKAGEILNLEDLSPRYRRNIQWFLRGRAHTLLYLSRYEAWSRSWFTPQHYDWDLDNDYPPELPSREEAAEWLESTPLMVRLSDLVTDDLVARNKESA